MFPEGQAFIGNCRKCDEPVIVSYLGGLKLYLDTVSVPYKDALVLGKYWDIVLNVWPDWYTEHKVAGHPVKFHVTQWAGNNPPSRGRLYIRHLCRIKRKAKKHGSNSSSS